MTSFWEGGLMQRRCSSAGVRSKCAQERNIVRLQLGFVFTVVLLTATSQIAAAQGTVVTWTVDGEKREALVVAPVSTAAVKRPLVFAFHGHGGNMNGAAQSMHIHVVWPQAIVVYPQGLIHRPTPGDPQGNRPGWQVEANQSAGNVGNKDLDFFDAMVATMKQKYIIDDRRVYTTGFSNGGIFSYLLWAERSKVIAAIGEVAGALWNSEHLTQARSLLAIGGEADTTDAFTVQEASVESARQIDQATGNGQNCPVPAGASGTKCTFYSSAIQTPVKTLFHPGAHIYPTWAPDEIVKFFKNHTQP